MHYTTETLPHSVELALRSNSLDRTCNTRRNGVWQCVSSNEFLDKVQYFAAGLITLGIKKGDTFGIMASSSSNWLVADLGAMATGCATVPMFVNISEDNLIFEVEDSEICFLFVDGEEALSRIAPHAYRFSTVVTANVSTDRLENQIDLDELLATGKSLFEYDPHLLASMLEDLDSKSVATIIYTSGSTGAPKGVELSHVNLLSQIEASGELFPLSREKDTALSCLPLAHVFERMVVYFYLCSEVPIYFVDDIQNLGTCLKEVRPTTMTMVPRLLEKLYGKMTAGADAKPFPLRQLARWAISRASTVSPARKLSLSDRIADRLVYSKFRAGLGGNFSRIIAGGAALAPKLHRFFLNIGLPVYQGYGLTEAAPVLSTNFPGKNKIGTVGPVFPGVEIKVDDSGEILARGENIMLGYHHAGKATREVIDGRGWLHTGDLGHLDGDGFLVIDGRAKELMKTSTGEYVSPVPIEQAICESELVDSAMVLADGFPFASVLIFVDRESLSAFRKRFMRSYRSDDVVIEDAAFIEKMQALLDEINIHLNKWERVRAFRCLLTPPTIENGELTPTMKLKREVVKGHYQSQINAIYSGHENIMLV